MKIIKPEDPRHGSLFDIPPEALTEIECRINDAIETTQRGSGVRVFLGRRTTDVSTDQFPRAVILAAMRKCEDAGWQDVHADISGEDNVLLLTSPPVL